MDFRFYKALPDASVRWPSVSMDDEQEPDFVLIALERTNDPDANNHTGFDYFGAYGDGDAIDTWAATHSVEEVEQGDLPNPLTFYPTPFNEA
jgi:hypothetical protein